MAKIVENHEGRRMIRLTPDDILAIVRAYQQRTYRFKHATYNDLMALLADYPVYLPEEM